MLDQIMPVLQAAIWEAWLDPLELIALNFGRSDQPAIALDPMQTRAGAAWADCVYPSDRERVMTFLIRPETAGPVKSIDYRLIVGEGELLWVRHWTLHRAEGGGGRTRLRGLITAIPEQKHLEWECLRVSERECNRIGQELHDDLCQVLAGVSFMMRVFAQRAGKLSPDLGTELDELNSHVIGATDRVRSMAHGLFPAQLNYATLRHALKDFARQMKTRFAVRVNLKLPTSLPTHTPEQIIQIYRIAQESVSNSTRHGRATEVAIQISTAPNSVQISLEDNGCGFPESATRPEGIGMHVMHYRARMLGGALRFKNLATGGAATQLSYPIATRAHPRGRKKKTQLVA